MQIETIPAVKASNQKTPCDCSSCSSDAPAKLPTSQPTGAAFSTGKASELAESGEDLVLTISNTLGQVVGSWGTNAESIAANNAAISNYNGNITEMAAAAAAAEQAERDARRKSVMTAFGLASLTVVFVILLVMIKKK